MGIEQETAEKILKEYLVGTAGLDEKAANRVIKGTQKGIKEELKAQKEEEKEEERKEREAEKKARVRHGTTCVGIIAGKKPITEW
jgi:hypothetical protein